MEEKPRFSAKVRGFLKSAGVYLLIILGTLVVVDVVLIASGAFPPRYDYGHPELGWVAAEPSGDAFEDRCPDPATGGLVSYRRNEAGLRATASTTRLATEDAFEVAVGGDSHTELCMANELTHFGVAERELEAMGIDAAVFALGAGKYSPLQGFMAVDGPLREFEAEALVLNVYTGNDFYDMLRIDDRPHFVKEGSEYRVEPPVWYQHDPPGLERRSRVLGALRLIGLRTGISRAWVRVRYLKDVASAQGRGLGSVIGYMNNLRKATAPELAYPQALVAQMLNQQLFFHHFPDARPESLERMEALLEMVRAEHPDLILIMSPIPSYELVHTDEVPEVFRAALDRIPVSLESGVAEESELYEALVEMAEDAGWIVTDHLQDLREYTGSEPLYNGADYHIEPSASEIIGRNQAMALSQARGTDDE